MRELEVANRYLDDRAALDASWERNGYWFFKNVLPLRVVEKLRAEYLSVLKRAGLVPQDATEAVYNGADLGPQHEALQSLMHAKLWKLLVADPEVHAFMRRVLGDEPFWIPIAEYRASPPRRERAADRFDFVHQDGFYNQGIPFRVCWLPLEPIDESVGGLAIAEGLHHGPLLHDVEKPPMFLVPPGAVPAEAWRRSAYEPGDLLMFDIKTPHSGLANYSNRFRLSMDIRVMGASGKVPAIGKVAAVRRDAIEVREENGRLASFVLDAQTFGRGLDGKRISRDEIAALFKPGDEIIVANENGRAQVVRPPR